MPRCAVRQSGDRRRRALHRGRALGIPERYGRRAAGVVIVPVCGSKCARYDLQLELNACAGVDVDVGNRLKSGPSMVVDVHQRSHCQKHD